MRSALLVLWYVAFAIAFVTMFPYMRSIGVGDVLQSKRLRRVLDVLGVVMAALILVLAFTAE